MNKSYFEKLWIVGIFYHFQASKQSILYLWWPLFRTLSPVLMGYLTFGQILEQNSGDIPYSLWVLTGVAIWIPVSSAVNLGVTLLNSNAKRRRFIVAPLGFKSTLVSILLMPLMLTFLIILYLSAYVYLKYPLGEATIKFLYLLLSYFFLLIFSVFVIAQISIVSSLARDLRFFFTWAVNALILVTPIFYLPRQPNSKIETLLIYCNPFVPILDFLRSAVFEYQHKANLSTIIWASIFTILSVYTLCFQDAQLRRFFTIYEENYEENQE